MGSSDGGETRERGPSGITHHHSILLGDASNHRKIVSGSGRASNTPRICHNQMFTGRWNRRIVYQDLHCRFPCGRCPASNFENIRARPSGSNGVYWTILVLVQLRNGSLFNLNGSGRYDLQHSVDSTRVICWLVGEVRAPSNRHQDISIDW